MQPKIVIGITQGDTNGIGYEVIIKALSNANVLEMFTPVVYGSSKAFGIYRKQIPDTENINTNIITSAKDAHPKRVNIVNCLSDQIQVEPGQLTHDSAKSAIEALDAAVKDLKDGLINIFVTTTRNPPSSTLENFKTLVRSSHL